MDRVLVGWCGMLGVAVALSLGAGCGNTGVDFGSGTGSGGERSTSSATSGSGTSSAGTAATGSTSSSSATSAGGCTLDPQDDACVTCSKQKCCSTLVPCQNDEGCVCWTGCLAQNPNNSGACSHCGSYDATTNAFVNCTAQNCLSACGSGSSSSSTGSASSTASSASSSAGNPDCAPAMGDTQCTTCAKMSCCNDVVGCVNDQNCTCIVECLGQGKIYQICTSPAPVGCGQPSAAFLTLAGCTTGMGPCASKCQ